MKSTGIVRNVDDLGRVVIPIELRKTLGLEIKDPLEFYTDGDRIILMEYNTGCQLCGSLEKKKLFKDKFICGTCIEDLKKLK